MDKPRRKKCSGYRAFYSCLLRDKRVVAICKIVYVYIVVILTAECGQAVLLQ